MAKENTMGDKGSEPSEERKNNHEYNVILTAYLDGGGHLQFHGGKCPGDLDDDVGIDNIAKVLRQFYIRGKIVDESGLTEPIRVT